ncbi:NTP/NDP exchange transporter [Mariniblastus fucicola]|nr:MFS transporter [Mariniblastus fucicola]
MLQSIEQRLIGDMTDYERSILRHGAVWFFLILFSYYILRPIREQIGSTYGIENLSWLFWATFVVMLIAIPLYSLLVGKFHRRILVPSIYAIFIGCLIVFWLAMRSLPESYQIWVARAFFVWISVYGLFIVSFFWSVAGDMLSTAQGRRIFGIMAGGGTIGGLVGSQVAATLVGRIGVANLLLIPVILLVAALFIYFSMERSFKRAGDSKKKDLGSGNATGGNPFAGFTAVFKSRYLFAICMFGIFLATCGTAVYFQQAEIVKAAFEDIEFDASTIANADSLSAESLEAEKSKLQQEVAKAARTQYFANVNFAVSIVTLIFQFFLVGWLMKKVGLGMTLSALPLAYVVGISALAFSPTIGVLAVVSVIGRSAEYGISNPAREVLFTAVNREDRYKAKSFIDTVVRRGGDSSVGGVYKYARESIGLAMTTLSLIMIPIGIAWIGLSLFIGFENRRIVASRSSDE